MNDSHEGADTNRRSHGDPLKPKETLRRVEEHYERNERLFATRTADGYSAVEKATREPVCLWVLRHALAPNSEAAARFVSRLDVIGRLATAVPRIHCYGVDTQGTAFLVTDRPKGVPLVNVEGPPHVLQEYFLECLRKVALLHQRGIVLGDISEHSFIVNPDTRRVQLVAILGTFEVEAHQTALLPPQGTLHYVAPEQRSGAGVEIASDVYALGVLGYRLFTGRYLFGEKPPLLGAEEQMRLAPAPSVLNAKVPVWVDDVLGKCIETQPANRYRDAGEVLATIEQAIKTGVAPGGNGRWSQRTLVVQPHARQAVERFRTKRRELDPQSSERGTPSKEVQSVAISKRWFVISLFFLIVIVTAGGLYLAVESLFVDDGRISAEFPIKLEDVPPELRPYLTEFYSTRLPVEHRREALFKIAESDDPFASMVLESALKQIPEPELKNALKEAIVLRLRNKRFNRTADFLTQWFRAVEIQPQPLAGGARDIPSIVLRACDRELPPDVRTMAVQKAYAEYPLIAIQLAAALALDSLPDERFVAVLRRLLVANSGRQELKERGLGALLLGDRTLSIFFEEDIRRILPEIATADLTWSITDLAASDSRLLSDVAAEILRRKAIPPFQAIFLEQLTAENRFALSPAVKRALVNGARNEISYADIVTIGRSYYPKAEVVLLAMCALARDADTQQAAFDALAALSLRTEPGRSLVEWVRSRFWDHRVRAVKPIGILGHSDIASREQLEYSLDMLLPFGGGGEVVRVLTKSGVERLIVLALERVGQTVGSDDLVVLLSNPSREVRKAAVKALQGRNDLPVLHAILRGYNREQDAEVRKQYEGSHWVVTQSKSLR